MKKLRLYIDTSVIGGCLDEEFAHDSMRVLELAVIGRIALLISDVVIAELERAPDAVRSCIQNVPGQMIEHVPLVEEAVQLRDAYLAANILSRRSMDDALHVALATWARADAIVSWNFKHIVRLDKIKAYNQVNLANGFGMLTIVSPREVHLDESDEYSES